jgi:polyglycine hydrolase-like protein
LTGCAPAPAQSSLRRWILLAAGVLGLAAGILSLLFAFDVIQISTPKGLLVIETNDPDVKVIVKQGGTVIVGPTSKRQIELKPGEYEIELAEAKEGLRLMTRKFTLSRNGREIVKVHFEPAKDKKRAGAITRHTGRYYSIHGADGDAYQGWIEEVEKTGYRPIFLNGSTINGRTLFAGIAVKNEFELLWEARHNLTAGRYQEAFEDLGPKEFRPLSVTGYLVGDTLNFGALWVKDGRPANWYAHHNHTLANYQAALGEHVENGMQPIYLTGYWDGATTRFSSLYINDNTPWVADQNLTEAQYIEAFRKYNSQGYRLSSVSGYSAGDQTRFAFVFSKDKRYQRWISDHNLTREEYEKMANQLSADGFYPQLICTYAWEGAPRYATIWVKDWPNKK